MMLILKKVTEREEKRKILGVKGVNISEEWTGTARFQIPRARF